MQHVVRKEKGRKKRQVQNEGLLQERPLTEFHIKAAVHKD